MKRGAPVLEFEAPDVTCAVEVLEGFLNLIVAPSVLAAKRTNIHLTKGSSPSEDALVIQDVKHDALALAP